MIDQGSQVRAGGDADRGFDHASDHHLQVVSASDADHFQGGLDAAAFHQLDVDPVKMSAQSRDVFGNDTASSAGS